jgi:hypothetical protein
MRPFVSGLLLAALMLPVVSVAGNADDKGSPIFGSAKIAPTTSAENKNIVGKGYYADYYGYYGYLYAYYATSYASSGYAYRDANSYYTAYQYANSAASSLYNAWYYQIYNL